MKKHKKKIFIIIFIEIILIIGILLSNTRSLMFMQKSNVEQTYPDRFNIGEGIFHEGKTYYISSDGKSNDGKDKNEPMSLETANQKTFYTNDKILFKRGDIFYGYANFEIKVIGNNNCYIGTYGEGDLPIISGAKVIENKDVWEKYVEGIYRADISNIENFNGYKKNTINSCTIGFLESENGDIYGNLKKEISLLENDYDFCCDGQYIYVKSENNPTDELGKITLATQTELFRVSNNCEVENIHFRHTGAHAIVQKYYNMSNIKLHNLIIEKIGGSYQYGIKDSRTTRYGNAIELWNGAKNVIIENNIIRDVYDAGITLQGLENSWENIDIRNNIIMSTCYSLEFWASGTSNGMKQINVESNYFINQGKGWGQKVRPNPMNSAVVVFYDFSNIAVSEINIHDNKLYNSERIMHIPDTTINRLNNGITIDRNNYYNTEYIYAINDIKLEDIKKTFNEDYKIEKNGVFQNIDEKEISKINNEEILKSNNYEEIKAYYENLEKEFSYEGLLNELLDKYKTLDNKIANKDVLAKINELKMKIQNKQNDDKLLTQAEIKELFDLHYDMVKVINQDNNTEIIDLTNKLNEFEEIYYKLFNLSKSDISYNKDLLRNKIENAKKIIEDNEELQTELFNGLMTIIQEYYDDSDSSINGLVCNKLLDVFYSYAYKNVKVYITYSEMNITNKDVVATLQSDIPIEMNMSNSHTFTENGSFTFKFVVNGEEKEITATVDWIDKKAPVITGYENRVDELEAVVINVTDENLNKIVVTLNGEYIDFNNGDTLFKPGNYQILATDKAGNSSEVTLRIVDYIESNKTYYISNNGKGNGLSESSPMNIDAASKIRFYAGDKILFKAGEKYKLRLDWVMMGSPDNKVVISSYGQGDRPIIDGYISLVSNLEISNIYFVNDKESSIVTNQEFSENIVISNCIFQDIVDTGIYLNRQVKNCEIKDCIFRNCTNAISMKNDFQNLLLTDIKIHDNIFVSGTRAIVISGRNENEVFEKVEIYNNIFMNYTSNGSSVISFGFIEDTKFDVTIYNNVYYNFLRAYSINNEYYENFKNNVRSDNNTFYSFNDSKFIENSTNFDDLNNSYNIDKESKNIVMDANSYKVNEVTYMANNSTDKNEIIDYMNQTISASNSGQSNNNGNKPIQNGGSNNSGSGVNGIQNTPTVTSSQLANKNSQKNSDKTMSQEKIPYTGTEKIIVTAIVALVAMVLFSGINYVRYLKDTRKQFKK